MADPSDWAERKYVPGTAVAHLVPFGGLRSLCGEPGADDWHGTGSFEEHAIAAARPLCERCAELVTPRS